MNPTLIAKFVSALLPGVIIAETATASPAEPAGQAAGALLQVTPLRCEYAECPLGIETLRPRLSWQLESDRRGQRQTGYRVLQFRNEL